MTADREVLRTRDVLRDVVADSLDVSLMDDACDAHRASDRRAARLQIARDVLAEIAAHPVELLALLAEPKVCETCGGDGDLRRTDGYPPGLDEVGKPCVTCHGTGSVAVDVLDLLVQAGKAEVLDKTATRVNNNEWRHYTVRHDATVYVAKDGTP